MSVTMLRWVWRTAAGSSRVVPDVYWNTARSSARVSAAWRSGYRASPARNASSATTVVSPGTSRAMSACDGATSSSRGVQSSMRRRRPSGPKSVKSGTAMAPRFTAPKSPA